MAKTLGAADVNIEFDALPRVLWIMDNEPAIYAETAIFLHPNEYLTYRLSGTPALGLTGRSSPQPS